MKFNCDGTADYVYNIVTDAPQACGYRASGAVTLNGVMLNDNLLGLANTSWTHFNASGTNVNQGTKVIAPKYAWSTASGLESNGSLRELRKSNGTLYNVENGNVLVDLNALPSGYRLTGWTCSGTACKQTSGTGNRIDMKFNCDGTADYVYNVVMVASPIVSCSYSGEGMVLDAKHSRRSFSMNTSWSHYLQNGTLVAQNTKMLPYRWTTSGGESADGSLHAINCFNNCTQATMKSYDVAGGYVKVTLTGVTNPNSVRWSCVDTGNAKSCREASGTGVDILMDFNCNSGAKYVYYVGQANEETSSPSGGRLLMRMDYDGSNNVGVGDFLTWMNAFRAGDKVRCDVNGDGVCSITDGTLILSNIGKQYSGMQ